MIKFNLYKSSIVQEAMSRPLIYRQPSQWYRLEDVVSGKVEDWNKIAADNDMYQGSLKKIVQEHYKRQNVFRVRYNLDEEQVKKIHQTYIGYQPSFGVYMASIGPYAISKEEAKEYLRFIKQFGHDKIDKASIEFGKSRPDTDVIVSKTNKNNVVKINDLAKRIESDRSDVFSFFDLRFQYMDPNKIIGGAIKHLADKMGEYASILSTKDTMFVSNNPVGMQPNGDIRNSKKYYGDLSLDSPSMQKMLSGQNQTMEGMGSLIKITPGGAMKYLMAVLKNECGPLRIEFIKLLQSNPGANDKQLTESINSADYPLMFKLAEEGKFGVKSFKKNIDDLMKQKEIESLDKLLEFETQKLNMGSMEWMLEEAIVSCAKMPNLRKKYNIQSEQEVRELIANMQSDNTRNLSSQDLKTAQAVVTSICKRYKSHYDELKKNNDPRIMFLTAIPNLFEAKTLVGGNQVSSALQTTVLEPSLLRQKKEIVDLIIKHGEDNAQAIADELNGRRKGINRKAKGQYTAEIIQDWIESLGKELYVQDQSGILEKKRTYVDLSQECEKDIETIDTRIQNKEHGFKNLDFAYRMFSLYFTGSQKDDDVDPLHRTRTTYKNLGILFPRPEYAMDNIEQEMLNAAREATGIDIWTDEGSQQYLEIMKVSSEKMKAELPIAKEDMDDDEAEDSEEVVEKDENVLVDDFEVAEIEKPQVSTPVETVEKFDIDIVPETSAPSNIPTKEEEEEEEWMKWGDDPSAYASALKHMIKISQEMDDEGKFSESEEIHKIIRKYIGQDAKREK